ncbi:pilin [Salinicoccus kekensis]|uniref:TrbC/VIRB2 family protein n=1 Tax=Salinicoccus kekensis TaxID=714307 RepID=A0A285UTE7_9STAP|nr:pilin [Salinicoccus kekensis]SOC45073.1 TrbC/VIRB2 family protein [Salinicoccus kekensis]
MQPLFSMFQFLTYYAQSMSLGAINQTTSTIENITSGLVTIGVPLGALVLVIAGIVWMVAGQQGPRMAKGLIIGVAVGLILIFAADALASWVASQASF